MSTKESYRLAYSLIREYNDLAISEWSQENDDLMAEIDTALAALPSDVVEKATASWLEGISGAFVRQAGRKIPIEYLPGRILYLLEERHRDQERASRETDDITMLLGAASTLRRIRSGELRFD